LVTVLDSASTCWIDFQTLLVSNYEGGIYSLKLAREGSSVTGLALTRVREEGSPVSAVS
jgi:hypothetical protein